MKYSKYLIYFMFMLILLQCKKNQELEWIKNSALEEIDLFLIPNKYNIMQGDWIKIRNYSKFNKSDLIRHLRTYGRTLEDLKQISDIEFTESENTIQLKVGRSAHSTSYDYDSNIPIVFYGPNWFLKGEFSDSIHQQHIVPTLTKILKIRNPNGVETHPVTQIIKSTAENSLPEIIVTIVIDQGGQQFYKAHPEVTTQIENIKKKAAYFPNALVGHLDSETAVGHAAIGTGAYPRKNGIIGNGYIKMKNGKLLRDEIYSTDESQVNPTELLTETIGDVLDHEYGGDSEIISQCFALRASIGMAGHGSAQIKNVDYRGDNDIVYWLDTLQSKWLTDTRYYTFPVEANSSNPLKSFNEEYPNGWDGVNIESLQEISKKWAFLMGSPLEVRLESELFRTVIQNHIINKNKHNDGVPDLAYLTIKSTDAAAHQFGFESIEAKETFREADKQIGLTFDFLQKVYGDKFILIITADHGGTPLPEISGGKRLTTSEFIKFVDSLLPIESKVEESLIKFMSISQISLNRELMNKYSISEEQVKNKILSLQIENKKFFKKVYSKSDLN